MKTNGENQELQRLMNARLWKCVEQYGGAQDMAKDSGMSPQTFYNMRDNRTFPSAPTIKVVQRLVKSLSMEAVYSDSDSLEWKGNGSAIPFVTPDTDQEDYKALFYQERAERLRLAKLNERLTLNMLEKAGLLNDNEGSKIESSSWTTVKEEIAKQEQEWNINQNPPRRMIGLTVKDDCRVIPMYTASELLAIQA